ncbi:MAG: FmdB family zinc ribbon protein [Anaerolineales bacterium]
MPTYEYRCQECHKRFEVFLSYAEYDDAKITCPVCNSIDVRRRIGKIRVARTKESRIEDMMDPSKLDGIEDDPKALGRLMRQMGKELGEDTGPEFEEVVSRLEKGQDPEQIEKEMPDLGESLAGEDTFGE